MKKSTDCLQRYKTPPLRIALTGGHGLVGSHLASFLREGGHTVTLIPRDLSFDECDVVINLAGENIAQKWTSVKKQQIYSSRIETTRRLVEKLDTFSNAPLLISASAVGYYGNRGQETLDDTSDPGKGFLANVCVDWEREAHKYTKGRLVTPRFGAVLTPHGGMLKKMLLPFRLCLGGAIGNGEQYMSWIAIDDLLCQLYHIIMTPQITGAINLTSPAPVTNAEFTRTLAKVLQRPAWFPIPACIVRLIFGELGDELLLASTRATPNRLEETGAHFLYPELKSALKHLLLEKNPSKKPE